MRAGRPASCEAALVLSAVVPAGSPDCESENPTANRQFEGNSHPITSLRMTIV
nr:MAG TPA: hypothetical protein [Caudoviricetes sp.]